MKRRFWDKILLIILTALALSSCAHSPEGALLADDYYNLAREFHELGIYDRAEFYYLAGLELDPEGRDSLYNLSLLYLETGEPDRAMAYLEKLYSLDRNNLMIMDAMGIAYSLKEEWEDALSWYDRVLEIFPWEGTALYNSALILTDLERPEESLERLERLWTRDKSYRTAIALWDRTGERTADERRAYLEEAETDDEAENLDLLKRRFDFYKEQDEEDKILELAGQLKEKDPGQEGLYWFTEGEILLKQYRTEEGLASVREAFRRGFNRESDISALADQLAPTYRDILLEMKTLYFPED